MVKLKSAALLCIFVSNLILSIRYGWNVLTLLSMILSATILVWDIWEAMHHG